MMLALQILIPALVFGITGFLLSSILPFTRIRFSNAVDRTLLGFFVGMGFYTLLFILLNAVFKVRINTSNVFTVVAISIAALAIYLAAKRVRLFSPESWQPGDIITIIVLVVIFLLALKARLINTQYFPGHLVDADPYRHFIRAKALLQTGMLSRWEPFMIGQVPVFEMQGCYVLTAIISLISGIDIWFIWKYGSILIGTSCVLSIYLMVKYIFGGSKVACFASAAFLAWSPIHIFRTAIGFAEPYALTFFPLAILFFLLFIEDEKYEYVMLFAFFFMAVAENNTLITELSFPLFFIFGIYMLIKKKSIRLVWGALIAIIFCLVFVVIWTKFYLGVSLLRGGATIGKQAVYYLQKDRDLPLMEQTLYYIGGWTIVLAIVGLIYRLLKPEVSWGKGEVRLKYEVSFQAANVFFTIFFFLYPVLYYCTLKNLFAIPGAQLYRYFSVMAFCFAAFAGIGSAQIINCLASTIIRKLKTTISIWTKIIPCIGYLILAILLFGAIYKTRPKTWWLLGPTEEEFVACSWINDNLPRNAVLAIHWYTGDFVKALTERDIVISPFHRDLIRDAIELNNLSVPLLKTKEEMVEFARGVDRPVYFFKSQYGPWFDLEGDLRFFKIFETGTDFTKMVFIYEVLKTPEK